MVSKRAVIRGVVQGVGYRANTQREASRIGGLSGWVRNLPDGSVELFVQGEPKNVAELLRWCAKGPRAARVDEVVEADASPDPEVSTFEVRF